MITSANFTEAAHGRNLEAGVLADDPRLGRALASQFESLAAQGILKRLQL